MYLIIDEVGKLCQTPVLSGRLRSQCRRGEVSIVNTTTMKGMNGAEYSKEHGEEWSTIQDLPPTTTK